MVPVQGILNGPAAVPPLSQVKRSRENVELWIGHLRKCIVRFVYVVDLSNRSNIHLHRPGRSLLRVVLLRKRVSPCFGINLRDDDVLAEAGAVNRCRQSIDGIVR